MMLIKGIKITLASLLFAVLLPAYSPANAPLIPPASQTLTICTSLKSGSQYISSTGRCNERIYEKSVWFQEGNSPVGTPGSKQLSLVICTSKGDGISKTLRKKCNPTTQVTSKWQRPLGPPEAPIIISVTADKLGTAVILKKAPVNNGGARITSYSIIEVNSSTGKAITANKALASSTASFPTKPQQRTTLTGLTPGMTYRFAATATNAAGTSAISESSAPFFAPTVPDAPTITSVIANGSNSAEIKFSDPAIDSGFVITSYTITALPGGLQSTFVATNSKSHIFAGLSPLSTYTFTISATNIAGTGLPSLKSNQITTFAPPPPPEPVAPAPSAPAPAPSTPALAAPAFTLSSSSETGIVNTAATGFTINSTGGAISSFGISATPAGMSFSTITGALSGTPTTVASATAYTVTATNASGSATQTFTLTINPGAATKAMMTTQPAGAVSGSAFTTQPVVRVTDSGGNTVTTFTGNMIAAITSGTGAISGNNVVAVAGVATFTNLVITGTGDHILTFTPEKLAGVNSETLTVGLSAQATLSITSLTTNTKAHDYSQALSITTSGGSGTGAITFAIASGGTATTCALSNSTATATITATTVGTCLIQATKAADATYASTTSATATFTFQVGSANKAMMTTQPAGAVNGVALTTQPVVRVTDSGGNTVTTSTAVVTVSISSGSGTLSGTTTATAVAGVATFTNLLITGTAGNFTLTFKPASLTAVTSSSFALAAGAATKVAITRASNATTDNVAFTTQPQITIQDSGGNTVTSSNAVVTATISAPSLIGTTTATALSGVATFTDLGIDGTNGTTYTITYTVSGLTVATAPVTLVRFCDGITFTCQIGDTGPGGGTIFYVATGTFTSTGSTCNTNCKYLEAAPTSGTNAWSDEPIVAWSGNTSVAIGTAAKGTVIGTGYTNTLAIVGQDKGGNTEDRAATKARAYRGPNNLSDWFLPSKDELIQMCRWQVAEAHATCDSGGFANTGIGASGFISGSAVYWSSTEVDADQADALNFGTGKFNPNYKQTNPSYVRPIRAFGAP
jgi:hypothetical protein